MDDDENCGIFAEVDFGHGPVEIGCTQTGKHEQHRCDVWITSTPPPPASPPERTNIFERNKDGHP
jgi:hypothetical protein